MRQKDPSFEFIMSATESHTKGESPRLEELIQQGLRDSQQCQSGWQDTECLFQDVGDFLVRTTMLLSHLAENMVNGQLLHEYAETQGATLNKYTQLSELRPLLELEDKHQALKSLVKNLHQTSHNITKDWRRSKRLPIPWQLMKPKALINDGSLKSESPLGSSTLPSPQASPEPHSMSFRPSPISSTTSTMPPITLAPIISPRTLEPTISNVISTVLNPPTMILDSLPQSNNMPMHIPVLTPGVQVPPTQSLPTVQQITSPQSFATLQVHDLLGSLTQRGTGTYICPHGLACTKGGVRNGELVRWERNSAFRAHLQKHEKQYRCELPGCPARGGFARVDQLRRHQTTVQHER